MSTSCVASCLRRVLGRTFLLILVTALDAMGTGAVVMLQYYTCAGEACSNPNWWRHLDWTHSAVDLGVLVILRVLVVGTLLGPMRMLLKLSDRRSSSITNSSSGGGGTEGAGSHTEEYVRVASHDGNGPTAPAVVGGAISDVDVAETDVESEMLHLLRLRSRQRQWSRKVQNVALCLVLALFTAMNVVVAAKCLQFHYTYSPIQEIAMAMTVLWVNMELLLVQRCLDGMIDVHDVYIPGLHSHSLRFRHDVQGYMCDACMGMVKKEGFKCPTCGYDICMACYREKSMTEMATPAAPLPSGSDAKHTTHSVAAYTRHLRSIFLPFWPLLLLSLLFSIGEELVRVLLPRVQGFLLDGVISGDKDAFTESMKEFLLLFGVLLVLSSAHSFCAKLVIQQVRMGVRQRLFAKIVYQDIAYFDATAVGTLTSRLTNDAEGMLEPVEELLESIIPCLLSLVGGIVMCFLVSWRLAMISVTVAGPVLFIGKTYTTWSFFIYRRMWDAFSEASRIATEVFTNIRTVRAFSTEQWELDRFGGAIDTALRTVRQDAFIFSTADIATNIIQLSATITILAFGGYIILSGDRSAASGLTMGQLITFQLYANTISAAYQGLMGIVQMFSSSGGAAERVLDVLEGKPSIDPRVGVTLNRLVGDLELRQVTYTYASRPTQPILKDISLVCPANSVTAIVGPSGGGKSTIMHLLLRLYDPQQGAVLVDGHDLRSLRLTALHQHLAVVSQDAQLFNMTIEENITYGMERSPTTTEDMYQASREANAHEFISEFPEGYKTIVGEHGVRLSGGQRQRIAIARALLRKPQILLLDEATSALDAESEGLVQRALDRLIANLHENCTIVVIAHRLSTVIGADKIVVLDGGVVTQVGPHEELMKDASGLYARLVSRQLQGGGGGGTNGT